jgi:hypothetical protein
MLDYSAAMGRAADATVLTKFWQPPQADVSLLWPSFLWGTPQGNRVAKLLNLKV